MPARCPNNVLEALPDDGQNEQCGHGQTVMASKKGSRLS